MNAKVKIGSWIGVAALAVVLALAGTTAAYAAGGYGNPEKGVQAEGMACYATAGTSGNFIDSDGDGVCDSVNSGICENNADGTCENLGTGLGNAGTMGAGNMYGPGDGTGSALAPQDGTGFGAGNGNSGASFVDANGDGTCDNAAEGLAKGAPAGKGRAA